MAGLPTTNIRVAVWPGLPLHLRPGALRVWLLSGPDRPPDLDAQLARLMCSFQWEQVGGRVKLVEELPKAFQSSEDMPGDQKWRPGTGDEPTCDQRVLGLCLLQISVPSVSL